MTLEEATLIKQQLNEVVDNLSLQLNSFPKNEIGLIPDYVRESNEFQEVDRAFNKAFKELQEFNKYYVKNFRKKGKRKAS